MLESLKRLFAKPGPERDLVDVSVWAQRQGHSFRRARGDQGFIIDGRFDNLPWRIEWGPPQRDYIEGHELRLRMELNMPADLQLLLLSRPLMEALERRTFEEFTDNVQTQIGTGTPEEMRWLVMFPKVDLAALKTLRLRFGAVASVPLAGLAWIEGALAQALEHASGRMLRDDPPFMLMTLRGRAYLRMQLATPEPASLTAALAIFQIAVAQALRVAGGFGERPSGWDSTANTAWLSLQPDDAAGAPKSPR